MKYTIVLLLLMNISYGREFQKREFVPILPINQKKVDKKKDQTYIELPKKEMEQSSEPDSSLFPKLILNWDK